MENPPDLLVAFTSDEQYPERKKVFTENSSSEQTDAVLAKLQAENSALQCELQQLRAQFVGQNNREFHEQSLLLQQRFQHEIQSVLSHHTELVQQVSGELSEHVTNVLRKSFANLEGLRLLHHKELSARSKSNIRPCLQHQSKEMNELCHHLIDEQRTNPMHVFNTLIINFHNALGNLKTSFDSKMNYLNDIHSSTLHKLDKKHQIELNEIQCELHLVSNSRI